MKGLVMKDFYMIYKYCRMYLLIAVIFAIGYTMGDNIFMLFYPIVLGSIMPVTLIAYDEKSKWQVYAETFPYTRKEIVTAKYLITLLYLTAFALLSAVSQAVHMLRAAEVFSLSSCLSVILPLLAVGLIVPGITLPAVFKLGTEKGRMAYYGIVVAVCGLFGAMGVMTDMNVAEITLKLREWMVPVLIAAGVVIFVISWMLSVKFYQEREL